jgi:hypothetical protein
VNSGWGCQWSEKVGAELQLFLCWQMLFLSFFKYSFFFLNHALELWMNSFALINKSDDISQQLCCGNSLGGLGMVALDLN